MNSLANLPSFSNINQSVISHTNSPGIQHTQITQVTISHIDSVTISGNNESFNNNEFAKMNTLRNSAFPCNSAMPFQLPNMPTFFPCGLGGIMGNIQSLLQNQMQMLLAQAAQILQIMQNKISQNQMLQLQMLQQSQIPTMSQFMSPCGIEPGATIGIQPTPQFPKTTGNVFQNPQLFQTYNSQISEYLLHQAQNFIENPKNFQPGITVLGSEEYKAQVNEQIAQLKKTPEGQKLFTELAKTGKPIRIAPLLPRMQGACASPDDNTDCFPFADGTPGKGCGSIVYFNPSDKSNLFGRNGDTRPTLFHELIHSYNYATGTMQEGASRYKDSKGNNYLLDHAEHQAIGLDNPNAIEVLHPDGIRRKGNPPEFTENAINRRLGIPLRDRYFINELNSHKIQSDVLNNNID